MALFGTRKNPKGPDLNKLKTYEFSLSGIKIKLNAPEGNDRVHRGGERTLPLNIYDISIYGEKELGADSHLPCGFYDKHWLFYGLSFFGNKKLGRISVNASISYLPAFTNLFRPRRFECALERYIYSSKRYAISGNCRKTYRRQSINGTDWSNYLSYIEEDETGPFLAIWQTPLTDEHLLTVKFEQVGSFNPVDQFEGNGLKQAYARLIDVIMQSVKIELPENIRSEQAAVKIAHPYESFAEHLPPYEYDSYHSLGEYDVVDKVSARYSFDSSSIPREVFNQEVNEEIAKEKSKSEKAHQKTLNDHLRFEQLEAEDYERYLEE